MPVNLPWADEIEQARAERIAAGLSGVRLLPRQSLGELFTLIRQQRGFVAVDTGLAHLACAAGLPGVVLYGPTSPGLTGATGPRSVNLSAEFDCAPCFRAQCQFSSRGDAVHPPCFGALTAHRVWQQLESLAAVPQAVASRHD